ncbi:hypothetical protein Fmac_006764 [Flemingia macrophylla]|uniref:Trichome birefringence-like N-terminal domain-containing protein n=1 Tax=Flemingia macrophylla TaxID=520843 RepID=A0ABD1NBK5_9FABA
MERHRSFSLKPSRLLLFSFTVFSSFLFLSTFTIWLTNSTPSTHQQVHLHFNTSSSVGPPPLTVPPLTTFTKNFTVSGVKVPTLFENRLARTLSRSKSEPVRHRVGVGASNVNFTAMQEHGTSPERGPSNEGKKVVAGGLVGETQVPILTKIGQKRVKGCDLTKGYWVFDESYPLYSKASCPFVDEGFDCEGNGRLIETTLG